jgi:hypothetical protein
MQAFNKAFLTLCSRNLANGSRVHLLSNQVQFSFAKKGGAGGAGAGKSGDKKPAPEKKPAAEKKV